MQKNNQSPFNQTDDILNNPQKVTPEQVQRLLNMLSPADKQKVETVLSDESSMKKVLSDPKAKALMKKFGGGK